MVRWEYKIINIRSESYKVPLATENELNALGEQGWELVSITSVNFKTGVTDNVAMIFKRTRDSPNLFGNIGGPLTPQEPSSDAE